MQEKQQQQIIVRIRTRREDINNMASEEIEKKLQFKKQIFYESGAKATSRLITQKMRRTY